MIARLDIKTPNEKVKVQNLSGGNQQKVAIGKWLLTDADVYLFDEPTKGVDVGAKRDIYELVAELAKRGKSILYASSEMSEMIGLTDRIYVMYDGKVVKELDTKNTNEEEILLYSTGGLLTMNTIEPMQKKRSIPLFELLYKYGTLITVLLLIVIFGTATDHFLNPSNIINILRSISIVTIIAIGLTVSLAVGGFDLSVGSVASLANALVISMYVWHGQSFGLGIAVTIAFCLAVGLVNAFLVINFKIQDMLMTLATMFVFQGVALTYTRGATVSQNMIMPNGDYATGKIPKLFGTLGQVPWIIIIMLVIVVLVHLFLTYTKHGRYMYMIGGNQEAAKLSGIAVSKYRLIAYLISALLAGIGGMILGARVMSAEVNAGAPI